MYVHIPLVGSHNSPESWTDCALTWMKRGRGEPRSIFTRMQRSRVNLQRLFVLNWPCVVRFLEWRDVVCMTAVCRWFREFYVESPQAWPMHIRLHSRDFRRGLRVSQVVASMQRMRSGSRRRRVELDLSNLDLSGIEGHTWDALIQALGPVHALDISNAHFRDECTLLELLSKLRPVRVRMDECRYQLSDLVYEALGSRVTELHIDRCNLFAPPMSRIGGMGLTSVGGLGSLAKCTLLQTLSLSQCRSVDARIVDLLEPLPALTSLDLSGSAIEDLSGLPRLTRLRTLNLSHIQNVPGFSALSKMVNLEELYLNNNGCVKVCSGVLDRLPRLRLLDLGETLVSTLDIGLPPSLTTLNLQFCHLLPKHVIVEALSALPALRCLNVASIYGSSPDLLQAIPTTAEHVVCSFQSREWLGFVHLAHLQRLISLRIYERPFVSARQLAVLPLEQLVSLEIEDCQDFTEADLKCLERLTRVESLCLQDCIRAGDRLFSYLRSLHLRRLRICGSNVTKRGVRQLARMTQLHTLELCRSRRLEADAPRHLPSSLRYLNLSNCSRMNDSSLDYLQASTPRLDSLIVDLHTFSDERLTRLRQDLSALSVHHMQVPQFFGIQWTHALRHTYREGPIRPHGPHSNFKLKIQS